MKKEGKVIKDFNDKENNYKYCEKGTKFVANSERYDYLKSKGYLDEGKELKEVK